MITLQFHHAVNRILYFTFYLSNMHFFFKYSIYLFDIAIVTVLCDYLHILIILAKAIGTAEIAHFCLNSSVYALMKSEDLSFFQYSQLI